jgi:hypothetical protein
MTYMLNTIHAKCKTNIVPTHPHAANTIMHHNHLISMKQQTPHANKNMFIYRKLALLNHKSYIVTFVLSQPHSDRHSTAILGYILRQRSLLQPRGQHGTRYRDRLFRWNGGGDVSENTCPTLFLL